MSAQYKSEYYSGAVKGPGCSYNTNCNYYGQGGTMASLRPGTVSGKMIVPGYQPIGYDALTHGKVGSCQQYFSIEDAYGSAKDAATYQTRLCNGGCATIGPSPSAPTDGPVSQEFYRRR